MRKAKLIDLLDNNKSVGDNKNQSVDELKFVPTAGVGKYLRGWKMEINSNMDAKDVKPIVSSKINEELAGISYYLNHLTVKMSLCKKDSEYTEPYVRSNLGLVKIPG